MIWPTDMMDPHALKMGDARNGSPASLVSVANCLTKPGLAMIFPFMLGSGQLLIFVSTEDSQLYAPNLVAIRGRTEGDEEARRSANLERLDGLPQAERFEARDSLALGRGLHGSLLGIKLALFCDFTASHGDVVGRVPLEARSRCFFRSHVEILSRQWLKSVEPTGTLSLSIPGGRDNEQQGRAYMLMIITAASLGHLVHMPSGSCIILPIPEAWGRGTAFSVHGHTACCRWLESLPCVLPRFIDCHTVWGESSRFAGCHVAAPRSVRRFADLSPEQGQIRRSNGVR